MKKVICLVLSLLLLVLPVSTASASVNNDKNVNTGAAYYVDSVSGDDSNDGKTTKTAWKSLDKVNGIEFKPGDKVLFKAGGMWTGQLRPHGSGVEGKPIIMDMYGTGNKPIINGAGITDKEETYAGNRVSTTFMLNEEEYWEINNLEIINSGNERENNDFRRGVYITAYNSGVRNHIYLKNLYVHDVFGHYTGTYADSNHQTYKCMGGILIETVRPTAKVIPHNNPSRFNDVRVEGCTIQRVTLTGMSVRGDYGRATNIVIRNNYLDTTGGDGIVVTSSIKALVEYNVAKNCHQESGCYAGMWTIRAIDTVFQYNEGYLIKTIDDGMAYDCDAACEGTIFQYNYSHDNEGGFMLIINNDVTKYPWADNEDNTIRYNISQNDKNIIFQFSSKNFNTKIYNNVIYLGKDSKTKIVYHGSYANIYNNIFYNLGSGGFDYDETVDFDYNCYYGSEMPGQPTEKHGIYADPQLVAPGTGAIGINTLNGYRLKATSPCINAGKVIENNGGKDFFSNPVPYGNSAPDIGACEYQRDAQDMETMNADFNKSTLDKGWKFIREDKNSWNLTEKSGYLKLNGENGDLAGQTNNMKNILVKDAPEYDYILTTKLDCTPLEQGQSAGLIIYGDDDNYISLTREFNALGGIYTLKGDIDGKNKSYGLIKDKISSGEVYLKIFREGTSYKTYYSSDNNNWISVGSVTSSKFANGKIGLFAAKTNETAKDFTAGFDYLHCDEYKVDIRTIEDDFDVDYLDGRWSLVKEDSSRWSLKDRPGYMRIKATPGTIDGIWDNNIKNILLTQSPVSDFEVITKMDFRPLANGQEAGIIIYSDDDNYLTLSRSVDTSSKTYRRYVMKSELNGVVNEFAANADVSCKVTMYFKLVKQGDTYTGYMKTEPSSWVYVGKFNNTKLSNFKVGLFATKGYRSTADINVDFDYFMYKPVVK